MGLLVVDRSNSAGDQRGFGIPLGCHWISSEPFLGRCSRSGDQGVKADCPTNILNISIDGLCWLAIAAVENGGGANCLGQ